VQARFRTADSVRSVKSRARAPVGGDRSGGNADALRIASGETAVLGDVRGAGCVKHVWVTLMSIPADPHELCKVVLRMYWDGEESPSVEVPVGDFFGMGFGLRRNFASLPLQMSPEDGKGFNCWFPMPFADGARFEVDNQGEALVIFYYYIDYEEYAEADPELARFHALWNRNPVTARIAAEKGWTRADYRLDASRPAGPGLGFGAPWSEPNLTGERNYVILDVAGRGQYVGCVLNVDVFERQVNDWYGEGDDMIFIDGEPWPPRLHGTGTPTTASRSTAAPRSGPGAARTPCTASMWRTVAVRASSVGEFRRSAAPSTSRPRPTRTRSAIPG
jgi:hypothetical protein